jgi:parvulin-like peptidyl-prolyl isomerase
MMIRTTRFPRCPRADAAGAAAADAGRCQLHSSAIRDATHGVLNQKALMFRRALQSHIARYLQNPDGARLGRANFPSDDDLQKVYDAYRAALLVPRQFQLAQIFVALPKGADKAAEDQSKKTVDDLERKLKTPGADFASLANNNGAKNGGDLGLLRENQIRPEIRAKVIELPKGAASEPIRLEDGWHLVKLIDTRAS